MRNHGKCDLVRLVRHFLVPQIQRSPIRFTRLICTIIADEEASERSDPMRMYYVNDGVYGSFKDVVYDYANPKASPLDVRISLNA